MSPSQRITTRLTRVTSGGAFIPEIDGLRFVAIGSVLWFHIAYYLALKHGTSIQALAQEHPLAWLLSKGHYGVELFFSISGFILALPFARQHLRQQPPVLLRHYFWRRLTRLEPPYLLTLALFAGLLIVVKRFDPAETLQHLLASSLYLHNAVYGEVSLINGVAWSLEVEAQFYIVAPLLAGVFQIKHTPLRRATILLAMAAAAAIQLQWIPDGTRAALSLANYVQYFLAGFLAADIYLGWDGEPPRRWWADSVGTLAWLSMPFIMDTALCRLLLPFAVVVAYTSVFCGPVLGRFFRAAWITAVGGMCYSIYLLHYNLMILLLKPLPALGLDGFWSEFALMPLAALAILAISAGFFLLVEKPCMQKDWPQKALAALRARRG